MTLDDRVRALEQRLRLLEDQQAILDVLSAYAHALDYRLPEVFANLWTETARITFNFDVENRKWPTGAENLVFEGQEEIMRFFGGLAGPPAVYHKHFVVDARVSLDREHAMASSYYARLEEGESGPVIGSFGRYMDDFVRCADGVWRIQERRGQGENRVPRQP